MNMHLYRRIRCGLIWVLCLMLGLTAVSDIAYAADGQNVTQNWSAEAAFYSASCEETETFHMTEEHFLQYKTELEARLILAYSTYYHQLSGEARTALKDAQKMWIDCYYLYIEALEQRWTQPVKIYFGITSKERKTNIYRDYILLMLMNRITDLEEWRQGRVSNLEEDFLGMQTKRLEEDKEQLQVDMGLCLYVIQEEFRPKIRKAHASFYDFLDKNREFVAEISNQDETVIAAEELKQVQQMSYLTQEFYQGCRFFRREREE